MSPIFRFFDKDEKVTQIDSMLARSLEEDAAQKGNAWLFPPGCRLFFVVVMGSYRRHVTSYAEFGPYYHYPDRYGHDYDMIMIRYHLVSSAFSTIVAQLPFV